MIEAAAAFAHYICIVHNRKALIAEYTRFHNPHAISNLSHK